MLQHEQFQKVMNKVDLTVVDLLLLEDHLLYIGQIHDKYGDSMPIDVSENLMNDVGNIITRLKIEHKKLVKNRLTKG